MKLLVLIFGILWCYNSVAVGGPSAAPLEDVSLTISPNEHKGKLIFLGAYVRLEVHGKNAHTGPEARAAVGAAPVLTSSEYWMSPELDTIAEAREGCLKQTRGRGTLVKIETPEEDQKVQDFLLAQGSNVIKHPEKFWTDGVCNKYREWKWNSNLALMGEYKNFFDTAGAQSGAIMVFQSTSEVRDDFEWRMEFDRTARHRYICEEEKNVPTPPNNEAVVCQKVNDLVLVLDASYGLNAKEYELLTSFLAKLAVAFPPPNRLSFVTYATEAQLRFSLTHTYSQSDLQEQILKHNRIPGYTFTGGGIARAAEELEANGRPGVPHKIVVFTDGESNMVPGTGEAVKVDEKIADVYTASELTKAKQKGIIMFNAGIVSEDAMTTTHGVGREANLIMIAGGVKENQFGVQDTIALADRIRDISIKICNA